MEPTQANFFKELYERKFYDEFKSNSPLQKVINFQKRLQASKSKASPKHKQIFQSQFLLQKNPRQFRPSTKQSHSRHSRQKQMSHFQTEQKEEGIAATELRILLNKKDHANILVQNFRQKVFLNMKDRRNKWTSQTQRENKSSEQKSTAKIKKIEFLEENHNIPDNYNKFSALSSFNLFNLRRNRKEIRTPSTTRLNDQINSSSNKQRKTLSKKVFIGGRDLQKAAEEYSKNYQLMNKRVEEYQIKLQVNSIERKKKISIIQRKSYQRKPNEQKQPNQHIFDGENKTQQKGVHHKTEAKKKYQEVYFQLDPWSVAEIQYI